MARSFAAVYTRIWADPEWRKLDVDAQHLYVLLISQDNMNLAGIIPYQLRRWSNCAAGWDGEVVHDALLRLSDRHFVVMDEDTEEVLVRTLIRNDGAYRAPGSLKAILTFAEAAQSPRIREVLAVELGKLDPLEGKTAAVGTAQIIATRVLLGGVGGPSGPGGNPIPDGTPDTTPDTTPDGTPDGIRDGFAASHPGSHPRWDVFDSKQPTANPTPDGTGSGSGSGSLLSLVRTLEGEKLSPSPDEPPLCAKHDGMDREMVPGCRACKRLRENWEAVQVEVSKPKPLPPLCGECDNRFIETDNGMARCPRCNPRAAAS